MINKMELIKLFEELEQHHDEEANNHNDELLSNPDEYRKLAYERANGIRDCLMVIYEMDEVEAIPIEWIKSWAMKSWVKTKKCEFNIIASKLIDDWREQENE